MVGTARMCYVLGFFSLDFKREDTSLYHMYGGTWMKGRKIVYKLDLIYIRQDL
jgi:hypothetical protein